MSEVVPTDSTGSELGGAHAAIARHDWQAAFDTFAAAERDGTAALSGADLEAYAQAAYFLARADAEITLLERAFRRREADGDLTRAAFLAVLVARKHFYAGKPSIASGWIGRAQRIAGTDGDTYAHGYLAIAASENAASSGDLDAALAHAERAVAIGQAAADADLRAYAGSNLGALKIAYGDTSAGLALMEEASVAAVNGELSPFASGVTACRMIGACRDLTDYRRASEWIEATERYCDSQHLDGFPGVCRIHRAEVASIGGAWERAEADLERATAELAAFNATPPQADGYYALGDIRRLRGDVAGAEAALREAQTRGRTPHPALALIRLAQGDVRGASAAIEVAIAEAAWDQWARARLLPAGVEIALAAGDVARARTAADELRAIVAGYPSPALEAGARVTTGRVLAAEGDPAAAVVDLRAAIRGWQDVGAPYEVARARVALSRALRGLGATDDADFELGAALAAFRELGAAPDATAAEREIREIEERRSRPRSGRGAFMFTDIVGSTTLAEALGDEAWEALLRWHDETLRARIERAGGRVVNSTGDGFFAAFDSGGAAVAAATAIQRALRDQRRTNGFAPPVRIGLHVGEATVRGDDYSGLAVHVAARIGALAGGGEILASDDALAEAGEVAIGERRTVEVKGVSAPVAVASVVWDVTV